MRTESFENNHDFEIYCQSDSLLVQFILVGFIETKPYLKELSSHRKKWEKNLLDNSFNSLNLEDLEDIYPYLCVLAGPMIGSSHTLPWSQEIGTLEKLAHYCYLLATRSESDMTYVYEKLYTLISLTYQKSLECKELLINMMRARESKRLIDRISHFLTKMDEVFSFTSRASRLLIQMIIDFKEDENILYLLLSKRIDFEEAFGRKCIEKIIHKMYPGGIQELKKQIEKKYLARGFKDIDKRLEGSLEHYDNISRTTSKTFC